MGKLTQAQRRVLRSHQLVEPRAVAWTIDLCQYRTWQSLYDAGLLHGGRLTDAGRQALTGEPG